MSASLDDLIPEFQPYARQFVQDVGSAGYLPQVTSTLRSRAQQTRLYRDYLRGGRGYPVAPPGTSAHEYGYAFDMVVAPLDALPYIGSAWQERGGLWGAGDAVHFEYPGFREDLAAGLLVEESSAAAGTSPFWDAVAGFLVPEIGAAQAVQALLFKDSIPLSYLTSPQKAATWIHRHILSGSY